MTEGSAPQTIVDVLSSDHEAITAALDDPRLVAEDDDGRTARTELVMELVRHFVAEEQYLYPTVRRLDGGAPLAEEDFAASRVCEGELRRLEAHGVGGPGLAAAVTAIARRFGEHVALKEAFSN